MPYLHLITLYLMRAMDITEYMLQVGLYGAQAAWVGIIRSAIGLIAGVDEWLPTYDIRDNALLRGLLMALVGFLTGVLLMIILAFAVGAWGIPCIFFLTILASAFVGIIADPEREWTLGPFPRFGSGDKPNTPLNL